MRHFFISTLSLCCFFLVISCQNQTTNNAAQEDTNTVVAAAESEENTTPKSAKYTGQWESVAAEDLGNGTYAKRFFDLTETNWEVKFTLYLDQELTQPVFQFRAVGPYQLEGASNVVEGADNAKFVFDKKWLTLLTDQEALINNFGFAACNLTPNVEQDITEEGCSFLVSKAACGQEYDLLKLDQGQLFFGMRPSEGDMCAEDRRPTQLFYPLKQI